MSTRIEVWYRDKSFRFIRCIKDVRYPDRRSIILSWGVSRGDSAAEFLRKYGAKEAVLQFSGPTAADLQRERFLGMEGTTFFVDSVRKRHEKAGFKCAGVVEL